MNPSAPFDRINTLYFVRAEVVPWRCASFWWTMSAGDDFREGRAKCYGICAALTRKRARCARRIDGSRGDHEAELRAEETDQGGGAHPAPGRLDAGHQRPEGPPDAGLLFRFPWGTTSALTKYNVFILSKGAEESNGKLQENQNPYAQAMTFGRDAQNVTGYARH